MGFGNTYATYWPSFLPEKLIFMSFIFKKCFIIIHIIHWIVLKFWTQTRKTQDKYGSKIAYSINGSWYFNKTNTFSSFEEENIGSIQFNGEIHEHDVAN